jgi:hypothetical protein
LFLSIYLFICLSFQVTRAQLKAKEGRKITGEVPVEIDSEGLAKIEQILEEIFEKVDVDKVYLSLFIFIHSFIH